MSELSEWTQSITHEVKVLVTGSLSEERADIRPSEAYRLIGIKLIEEGDRLARSVEGLKDGLAN